MGVRGWEVANGGELRRAGSARQRILAFQARGLTRYTGRNGIIEP